MCAEDVLSALWRRERMRHRRPWRVSMCIQMVMLGMAALIYIYIYIYKGRRRKHRSRF